MTPPRARLSRLELSAYAVGWLAHSIVMGSMGVLYPIYNVELGLSAVTVGTVLALGRAWDAFTDVWMGNMSDNHRGRWGRRRPFIFGGALSIGAVLPWLFIVPSSASHTVLTLFMATTLVLTLTAYTVYVVPLLALGFEMANDTPGRTRIQAWRAVGIGIGNVLPAWAYRVAQTEYFPNAVDGIRWVAIGMGFAAAAAGILPAIFCREPAPSSQDAAAQPQKIPLVQACRTALKNRPFVILILFTMAFLFGNNIVNALGIYVGIYHLYEGDRKLGASIAGMAGTVMQIAGFAVIPLIVYWVKRYGKKTAIGICLWSLFVGALTKWITYDPRWPYLHLFTTIPLLAVSTTGFWIVVSAMKADVCDLDELNTGLRRAGLYGAVSGWFSKLGSVSGIMASGFLVEFVGVNTAAAVQSDETIFRMRLFYFAPSAALAGIALLCWSRYSLDEPEVRRIRAELDRRHATVAPSGAASPSADG